MLAEVTRSTLLEQDDVWCEGAKQRPLAPTVLNRLYAAGFPYARSQLTSRTTAGIARTVCPGLESGGDASARTAACVIVWSGA